MKKQGFTLIELIIVIAVIALLAAAVFVAVDPAKRIGQARDAQRWSDVTAVADAIMKYVVDNNGTFATTTPLPTVDDYYLIAGYQVTGTTGTTCQNATIDGAGAAIRLDSLVPTYLPTMPTDPSFTSGASTQYYFMRNSAGRIKIGACEESDYATASIYVQR
ncbi:prepilin-type N-terminal cleavage/methylation domain-containing protein [Candidatus Nomurabacteria bacterium]|nr:prepilin-type N-terminal cleavage/methylation domain-containing protein [Candidatus Nomurabacteria bacterium]